MPKILAKMLRIFWRSQLKKGLRYDKFGPGIQIFLNSLLRVRSIDPIPE